MSLHGSSTLIERNLGNLERIVRLLFGLGFFAWAMSQPVLNAMEWFVVVVSLALILNGVFSRCYLWFVLDINSHSAREGGERGTGLC